MQASERMVAVRISYKKLWMLLLERDIKPANKKSSPKQDLSEEKFTGSR